MFWVHLPEPFIPPLESAANERNETSSMVKYSSWFAAVANASVYGLVFTWLAVVVATVELSIRYFAPLRRVTKVAFVEVVFSNRRPAPFFAPRSGSATIATAPVTVYVPLAIVRGMVNESALIMVTVV